MSHRTCRKLSINEVSLLRQHYTHLGSAKMAKRLGRHPSYVCRVAKRLGIQRIRKSYADRSRSINAFIRKNHKRMTNQEMADKLQTSLEVIANRKHVMRLVVYKRIHKQRKRLQRRRYA